MNEDELYKRLIDVEMALDNQQKEIDDLSEVIFKQGKTIDTLLEQNKYLKNLLSQDVVKPQSEEVPPPHY